MNSLIDSAIIILFLGLTLIVGMMHGRSVKNIADYALGGRNFSTAAIAATVIATYASGSGFISTLSKTYTDGFFFALATLGIGTSLFITSIFLIPRMKEFLGDVSIAEAMGKLYGKEVRVITAVTGTIGSVGSMAVQFKAFGSVFAYFMNIPPAYAIICAGLITTAYSAFGGIRAVTFTDMLQGATFGVIIPLLGFIVWSNFYYEGKTFNDILSTPQFNLKTLLNPSNSNSLALLMLFIYFCMPSLSASEFQRISIGKNVQQVKKAFIISGIVLIILQIFVAWIPFLVFAINPELQVKDLLPYIVNNYTFIGLKGMILIAIIAFAMSTADSKINASSVLFTNDIFKVLTKFSTNEIFVSRCFAFFLGSITIYLSLIETDLLKMLIIANSFYSPLVVPPFIMAIFRFRSSKLSVLAGMLAGLAFTIIWMFTPDSLLGSGHDVFGFFAAMICNIIILFAFHYLTNQPGGWMDKEEKTSEELAEEIIEKDQKYRQKAEFNLIKYCLNFVPKNDSTCTLLGLYFIVFTITTMYSTQSTLLAINDSLIQFVYPFMMVTGTIIAMYPLWPASINRELRRVAISIFYPLAIFYMLIFLSCFFVLVSKFSILQVSLFSTNLMIASLLLGWRIIFPAILAGFYLAVLFYQQFFTETNFILKLGSPEFILVYASLISASAILLFLKPKQEALEVTTNKANYLEKENDQLDSKALFLNQKLDHLEFSADLRRGELAKALELKNDFLKNLQHESRTPLTGIIGLIDVLHSNYEQMSQEKRKDLMQKIFDSGNRLNSYISNIIDLSNLTSERYKFDNQKINLSNLLTERLEYCRKLYIPATEENQRQFILDIEANITAHCDQYYLSHIFDNIIINAIQYCKAGRIIVTLSTSDQYINFSVYDEGIGVPENELFEIFGAFSVSSLSKTPAGGRGVGLALCQKIIELYHGNIKAVPNERKGVTFHVTLPR